jgi:hypothetical protein
MIRDAEQGMAQAVANAEAALAELAQAAEQHGVVLPLGQGQQQQQQQQQAQPTVAQQAVGQQKVLSSAPAVAAR